MNKNWSRTTFLMQAHSSTNFDIKGCYEKEIWFNGACSINNLPAVKDATYVINLNKCANIGNHLVAIYFKNSGATYFHSFSIDYNRY